MESVIVNLKHIAIHTAGGERTNAKIGMQMVMNVTSLFLDEHARDLQCEMSASMF